MTLPQRSHLIPHLTMCCLVFSAITLSRETLPTLPGAPEPPPEAKFTVILVMLPHVESLTESLPAATLAGMLAVGRVAAPAASSGKSTIVVGPRTGRHG